MRKNTFRTGRGGVFKCQDCGKMTRDTGRDQYSLKMCSDCLNCQEWANGILDGMYTLEDVPEKFRDKVESYL